VLDAWSLQILVAVADHGSFSAAGAELSLTQPAVSRQVAALERRLGVSLFARSARGVTPTAAGAAAVQLARGVVSRIEVLEATVRSFGDAGGGRLRIGGFPSVNTHFLPKAIHHFSDADPGVTVALVHVDPLRALDAVRGGDVDVALVTDRQLVDDPWVARVDPDAARLVPGSVDDVALTPLRDEELHVALAADHPLARRRRVPLEALADERWIDGTFPDCLGPLPTLAAALGREPEVGYVCDDWNGKLALVASGAGVSLVPRLANVAVRRDVVVRETVPALPARRLLAASLPSPFRTPPVQAFLDVLVALAPA
jgi:DNA-binding transcriptional LysR family regulator